MRKLKSAAAILAVAAGLIASPIATGTASANTYTTTSIERCIEYKNFCVYLQAYSTYSSSQVWINGHVYCNAVQAWAITWCGVGGGNGTAYLNVGVNWDWLYPPSSGPINGLYERIDIFENGKGCETYGSNADLDYGEFGWYTAEYRCEGRA